VGTGTGAYILKDCAFFGNKNSGIGAGAVDVETCENCSQGGSLLVEGCNFDGNESSSADLVSRLPLRGCLVANINLVILNSLTIAPFAFHECILVVDRGAQEDCPLITWRRLW
jgi:hypothetical protein